MLYGTLRLTTPDGQVREYPLDSDDAILGRATGNRIVVDHVSVSRRHAMLTIEDGQLSLEDLHSATGTYLNGLQIEAGARHPVASGSSVRFGDVHGTWVAAFVPAPPVAAFVPPPPPPPPAPEPIIDDTPPVASQPLDDFVVDTSPAPPPPPPPSTPPVRLNVPVAPAAPQAPQAPRATPRSAPQAPGDASQFIGTSLASPNAPVAAGQSTSAIIAIHNRGSVVDEISIRVLDLPEGWARVTRPQLTLLPGARDEVNIVIQAPKEAGSRAGEHGFSVAVGSREHRVEVRSVGKFNVLPFEGMTVELKPVRSKKAFRVEVANEGNTNLSVDLEGHDDESLLTYAFSPAQVNIEPGGSATVPLTVAPANRRLFGKSEVKPFAVDARSGSNQLNARAQGQLLNRPPLEPWKWPFMLIALVAVLGVGAWQYRAHCGGGWPVCGAADTAPARPDPTPTATASATASRTGTATASATATATATTATATTPPPAGLRKGGTVEVINSAPNPPTNTNCLAVRSSPARLPGDPNIVIRGGQPVRLCNGVKVQIIDGPTNDGVFLWWIIKDPSATESAPLWAAEKKTDGSEVYLKPAD
ncbi:MAG: FHA domain-containing protein [Dehalococcoidia bacterium]